MTADAIECIADDYKLANASVEKRFNAKMVARTKQLFVTGVPNRKGKISPQTIDASRAPHREGMQNQIPVRRIRAQVPLGALQFVEEIISGVEPRMRHTPVAVVHVSWRSLAFCLVRGAQYG